MPPPPRCPPHFRQRSPNPAAVGKRIWLRNPACCEWKLTKAWQRIRASAKWIGSSTTDSSWQRAQEGCKFGATIDPYFTNRDFIPNPLPISTSCKVIIFCSGIRKDWAPRMRALFYISENVWGKQRLRRSYKQKCDGIFLSTSFWET